MGRHALLSEVPQFKVLPVNTDLDTVATTGKYAVTTNHTSAPFPNENFNYYLEVIVADTNNIYQMLELKTSVNDTNIWQWSRHKNASTWQNWRRQNFSETQINDIISNQSSPNVLIGEIKAYAGTTIPTGFLECDGSEVFIIEYPDLFNVIQYNYGAATTDTFLLPDLRDKFLRGSAIGETGGTDAVVLAQTQIPYHTHATTVQGDITIGTTNTAGRSQTITDRARLTTGVAVNGPTNYPVNIYAPSTNAANIKLGDSHSFSGTSNQQNGVASGSFSQQPISTVPSYVGVKYIIRATY